MARGAFTELGHGCGVHRFKPRGDWCATLRECVIQSVDLVRDLGADLIVSFFRFSFFVPPVFLLQVKRRQTLSLRDDPRALYRKLFEVLGVVQFHSSFALTVGSRSIPSRYACSSQLVSWPLGAGQLTSATRECSSGRYLPSPPPLPLPCSPAPQPVREKHTSLNNAGGGTTPSQAGVKYLGIRIHRRFWGLISYRRRSNSWADRWSSRKHCRRNR